MPAYTTVILNDTGTPVAAAAFFDDSVEVVSLNPDSEAAEVWDRIFDMRIAQWRTENPEAESTPDDIMNACWRNNLIFTDGLTEHGTDEEALDAIYSMQSRQYKLREING